MKIQVRGKSLESGETFSRNRTLWRMRRYIDLVFVKWWMRSQIMLFISVFRYAIAFLNAEIARGVA